MARKNRDLADAMEELQVRVFNIFENKVLDINVEKYIKQIYC